MTLNKLFDEMLFTVVEPGIPGGIVIKGKDKFLQAVKDRVKSKGLSEEEIKNIIYKHCKKVKINSTEWVRIQLAQAIHTEMDKAMKKL